MEGNIFEDEEFKRLLNKIDVMIAYQEQTIRMLRDWKYETNYPEAFTSSKEQETNDTI